MRKTPTKSSPSPVIAAAMAVALIGGGCEVKPKTGTPRTPPAASPAANKGSTPTGARTVGQRWPEYAGAHILIAYEGSRARAKVKRTKEQARKLAEQLLLQAKKAPATFSALARKHSDGPSAGRGGSLGSWRQGQMVPAFDRAIAKLKVGEIGGPVATRFGFHVIQRRALPPLVAGAHILVAYQGARRARPSVTRSKDEARKLAGELAAKARKAPSKFAELARASSDGPSAVKGGSLGKWRKGKMVPAFDRTIEKLKVGQISDPVETPFGFHVIKRVDPANVR